MPRQLLETCGFCVAFAILVGCNGSAAHHDDAAAGASGAGRGGKGGGGGTAGSGAAGTTGGGGVGMGGAAGTAGGGGGTTGAAGATGGGGGGASGIAGAAGSGGAGTGGAAGTGGGGGAAGAAGMGGGGSGGVGGRGGGAGGGPGTGGTAGAGGGAGSGGTAGAGPCLSGATGDRVARFRWAGSGSGSTAYVVYEANNLPDTTRWRVTAGSASIGYTPVFADPFLGVGGLDLEGTVFIDVEFSTAGLASISKATIAVFGRSYNTTASGSFSWQTIAGTGATPTNFVSNVAPYSWYAADATAAFRTGDSGALLRLRAGPSSNALIVNRVEICLDAR